jgi:inosine/xanthosine triphosphatase
MVFKVAVGSTNPVKVKAAENVMRRIYGNVEIISVDVASNVSHTPLTDEECAEGAIYRAKEAIRKAEADLGVGLEGGVAKRAGRYFLTGWCAVVDVGGDMALGCGGGIELPEVIVREVLSGKELGDVMDEVTGISGTKRKMGAVGILTNGLTSRQESWEFTLLYAMARKLSAELYSKMDRSEL